MESEVIEVRKIIVSSRNLAEREEKQCKGSWVSVLYMHL